MRFILIFLVVLSSNAFSEEAFEDYFAVAFTREEEWSEERINNYVFDVFERSFKGNGVDGFYDQVLENRKSTIDVLTVYVLASYSGIQCLDPSVKDIKSLERELAYCNSAASRSKSNNINVWKEATNTCVKEVLYK